MSYNPCVIRFVRIKKSNDFRTKCRKCNHTGRLSAITKPALFFRSICRNVSMMIHYISIPQYQVYDNTLYSLYAGNFFKAEHPFRNIGTSGSNPLQMFHPLRCFIIGANRISGKRVFEYRLNQVVLNKVCRLRVRHTLFKNA